MARALLVLLLPLLAALPALAHGGDATPLSVFGRAHLLVLHLPIGLLLVLFAMEVFFLLRKQAAPPPATRFLVVAGVAAAVLATATGLRYESMESFHGRAHVLVERHELLGIATSLVAVLAAVLHVLAEKKGSRALRTAYLLALGAASAQVAVTGHLGGSLVHGEGFLLRGEEEEEDLAGPTVVSDGDDEAAAQARERWPDDPSILARGERVDFARDVLPIFERSCLKCHGPEKRRGKLRLDKKKYAMHGGESGEVIIPGDPERSLLVKLVALPPEDDDVMPEKGKLLSASEIELIRKWIREGAHWPDD